MERISCFQQNKFAVLFSLMAVFLFPFCSKAVAQDSLRSVKLSEVKVEGMRMIHHTDHDSYMPTKFQREHASNGLDLLSQMHLPGLRIDQVDKSVSYTHGTGSVMVRINDVESTIEDLLAIPPSQLIRVEYTSAPGMKYGQGVAVVLNVRTRCDDMGMAFGYLYSTYNRGFVSPRISSLYDVNGKKYSLKADIDYTHQLSQCQSLLSFAYRNTGR